MFLFKLIVTLIIVISNHTTASKKFKKYQKKENVNLNEGEGHYLTCYEEYEKYNPDHIYWSYGKDLGSLKQIELNDMIFDYSLNSASQDQAGFYSCKFVGGIRHNWMKLFHVTVKGNFVHSLHPFINVNIDRPTSETLQR